MLRLINNFNKKEIEFMFMHRIYNGLKDKERIFVSIIFLFLLIIVFYDLSLDDFSTLSTSEIIAEILIILLSLSGFLLLFLIGNVNKKKLQQLKTDSHTLNSELEKWKLHSTNFILEFQEFIDDQFVKWKFTPSEKDVAIFLLKGLSFEEIANIRQSSPSTVRNQAHRIYEKSALNNRYELSAFFMEELFN